MAEPVLPAGGAPRRWWDLTPKERNLVAFTLLFLITLPMLTKIFTSDLRDASRHRAADRRDEEHRRQGIPELSFPRAL